MSMELAICWGTLAVFCVAARVLYWLCEKKQHSRRDAKMQRGLPDTPTNIPMPQVKPPLLPEHRTGPGGDTDQAVDKLLQHLEDDDKGSDSAGAIELVISSTYLDGGTPYSIGFVEMPPGRFKTLREAGRELESLFDKFIRQSPATVPDDGFLGSLVADGWVVVVVPERLVCLLGNES